MATATLDVAAVRARFPALRGRTAYFDGPGGTQCPDAVIEAISSYLRESNANLGGAFAASRRSDELVEHARERAGAFLGCADGVDDECGGGHDARRYRTTMSP